VDFEAQRPGVLSAVMVLTRAVPDTLSGRWISEDVDPELLFGFWNLDAWVTGARYADFAGLFTFRMAPNRDQGLECVSGRFNDGDVSQPVFCEMTYLGP
jgi:hypothetical protein